jgi:hypothetical protein
MEHEILDLIDRYWKFDNDQTPVSNWHDKQDLLEAVRKALRIHDVMPSCEGNCGMNYCDDNGCIERKRILVEPKDLPEHEG